MNSYTENPSETTVSFVLTARWAHDPAGENFPIKKMFRKISLAKNFSGKSVLVGKSNQHQPGEYKSTKNIERVHDFFSSASLFVLFVLPFFVFLMQSELQNAICCWATYVCIAQLRRNVLLKKSEVLSRNIWEICASELYTNHFMCVCDVRVRAEQNFPFEVRKARGGPRMLNVDLTSTAQMKQIRRK